jgi:hypothetical protein
MHPFVWFWTTGIHDPVWLQAFGTIALVVLTLATLIYLRSYVRDTRTLARTSVQQIDKLKEQTEILRQSVATAQVTADAAKTSADVAAGMSIPTLIIHQFGVGDVGNDSAEAFFQYPKIRITVKNYGQTPALLKWWSICFTCEDLPEFPVYWGHPGSGIHLEKAVVQPGQLFTLPDLAFFHRRQFSPEDIRAIISREKTFNAYGYICYGDLFNHPLRRLKFCETVLNVFGDGQICDWFGELAPPAYRGTEQFPMQEHIGSLRK